MCGCFFFFVCVCVYVCARAGVVAAGRVLRFLSLLCSAKFWRPCCLSKTDRRASGFEFGFVRYQFVWEPRETSKGPCEDAKWSINNIFYFYFRKWGGGLFEGVIR